MIHEASTAGAVAGLSAAAANNARHISGADGLAPRFTIEHVSGTLSRTPCIHAIPRCPDGLFKIMRGSLQKRSPYNERHGIHSACVRWHLFSARLPAAASANAPRKLHFPVAL